MSRHPDAASSHTHGSVKRHNASLSLKNPGKDEWMNVSDRIEKLEPGDRQRQQRLASSKTREPAS